MYNILVTSSFTKSLKSVKNKKHQENIKKKMYEIANTLDYTPNHYKNLHKPLQEFKRVHINNNFVILFKVNIKTKEVIFYNYKHHNQVYKWK